MTKKHKHIMTGLIIWAGLLIVILYSPIGSPELYTSQNYYVVNQNITATFGVTPNSPKINYSAENSSNELDIPQGSPLSNLTYSARNYSSKSISSPGSSYSEHIQTYQSNNSSGETSINGGGNSFIASGGSRSSAGSSGVAMNNGITALTLTDLSTQTPKQSTNTNITSDPTITDPGDDPFGPPIPVGDGWGLLTFLGFCYAAFKMRSLLFRKLQFLLSKRK